MNDDKHLVIHFNNGTEMEVSFPNQIKNSLGAIICETRSLFALRLNARAISRARSGGKHE